MTATGPSPTYTTLVLAMKMARDQAELREWGSAMVNEIQKLEPVEQERLRSEYRAWNWLLGTKGEGQTQ